MRQTKVTTLRGTDGAKSDLGFNFGGGGFGGGFGFDSSFDFGGGFEFDTGGLNFSGFNTQFSGLSFSGNRLEVGQGFSPSGFKSQLPTGLSFGSLPSLSEAGVGGGPGEEVTWKGLAAYLIAQGPKWVEAFRRGKIGAPKDAPPEAKSSSKEKRLQALLKTLSEEDGSEDVVAGLSGTQVALAAGVSAVAITLITQS